MAPDPRVRQVMAAAKKKMPAKMRPLLFRKGSKRMDHRLCIRYKSGHFVYLKECGERKSLGQAADPEHYLTCSHDVATGTYVTPAFCFPWREPAVVVCTVVSVVFFAFVPHTTGVCASLFHVPYT